MDKIRIYGSILLGTILLISAFAGGISPISLNSIFPSTGLAATLPANAQALSKPGSTSIDTSDHSLTAIVDTLFRINNVHNDWDVNCANCHGSTYAIYPTAMSGNDEQSIRLQGHIGPIVDCLVCHVQKPEQAFWHFGGDY